MGNEIDVRDYNELTEALQLTQNIVYKEYLGKLSEYSLILPDDLLMDEEPARCIRMFHLEQLTCKKDEDGFQKLSTVYHAATSLGCSVFVMIDAPGSEDLVNIYMGVRAPNYLSERQEKSLRISFNALEKGLNSNFPGSRDKNISASTKIPRLVDEVVQDGIDYIASVSCVASIRDNDKTTKKEFVQGIEKLIDSMHGKAYTALFIADPVSADEQTAIRSGYENLYSTLSAFRKSVWSYHESEGDSVMKSLSHGISKTVTESVSHTQSHTVSHTKGMSDTVGMNINVGGNFSKSSGTQHSTGTSSPTGISRAGSAIGAVSGLLAAIPTAAIAIPGVGQALGVAKAVGVVGVVGAGVGAALQGSSTTESDITSMAKSLGASIGMGRSHSQGTFSSDTQSDGVTEGTTTGSSEGSTDTSTEGNTHTAERGKSLQIEMVNKKIDEILNRIDEQLKRVKCCEDYGAYSCGAYFLSSREENALLAANTYRALMVGEGSSVERGAVNIWNDKNEVTVMKEYLRRFAHPVFAMPVTGDGKGLHMAETPGTIVSGLELPLHLGLPTKSVVGLPVISHAEFGRNILEGSDNIKIGKLYHMGRPEDNISVALSKDELVKHVFITGSTGSGKSNTIYKLLERLQEKNVSFLVVEPAKGEYKHVFGQTEGVSVYGTNPGISPLLRINPFSFPDKVHILEHLDRLVEIFNVCWPMYAAMPAVLKSAIEKAYVGCGWDLITSTNKYDDNLYPDFADVARNIKIIIDESEYDQENKGAYKGSLLTRLQALTTGINGLIFSSDEVMAADLFEKNVIVDLSRIGSSETKSLIMGMLVLKLQEFRMTSDLSMNASLRHVTVLEEAHNLLRRTSIEQPTESSNILGKSVEMIANAIAEMRTYGEAFIIADQAPGLMDISVIRNTNTKIIMKLPDQGDRELVGRSANLNDDQIDELAKLPCGVAAVYQNEWVQPVLCKIDKYQASDEKYLFYPAINDALIKKRQAISDSLLKCIMDKELFQKGDKEDLRELKSLIIRSGLESFVKVEFLNYIETGREEGMEALRCLIYDLLKAGDAIKASKQCGDIHSWVKAVVERLDPSVKSYSNKQIDLALMLILQEQMMRDMSYQPLLNRFMEVYQDGGGVF